MGREAPPPSWLVEDEDLGGGLTRRRYAYADGSAANVVVPTAMLSTLDDPVIATWVKDRPPPPPKT